MSLNNDYRQLKDLLVAWKLPELYEYFRDEGINIGELELMKPHHVAELLANHRMGLRIRFEHRLEVWRRDLNKPIASRPSTFVYGSTVITSSRGAPLTAPAAQLPAVVKHDQGTNTEPVHKSDAATTANVPIPTATAMLQHQQSYLLSPPPTQPLGQTTMPPLQPAQPPNATISSATEQGDCLPLMPPLKLRKLDASVGNLPNQSTPLGAGGVSEAANCVPITILADPMTPVDTEPSYDDCSTDTSFFAGSDHSTLAQILQDSGQRGAELIDYYNKHKEFSANTRTVLIHLIVNYFERHNYHLSLNTSHQLEREILQMFPNERLENFRTEKRGKIYVKFCNMKRYKKDRPDLRRKMSDRWRAECGAVGVGANKDVAVVYGNNESDEVDDEDYAWNEPKVSMVEIKTESDEDC